MRYPKLKAPEKRRVLIDRFRGYEHLPAVSAGAFYDMQNLSGDRPPLLVTRGRRTQPQTLDGCPVDRVLAVGGRGRTVVLDADGSLWCGGAALPRLLEGSVSLSAWDEENRAAALPEPERVLRTLKSPGEYRYRCEASADRWSSLDGGQPLSGNLLDPGTKEDGTLLRLVYRYSLRNSGRRQLVFLGAWVCVFPDGKFANTVKLRNGDPMREAEDYGDMAQLNSCDQGGTLFTPCGENGEELPAGGSGNEAPAFVKCAVPGIAKGLHKGDYVELSARLESNQGGEAELEALWSGSCCLQGAWHDPGAADREEGRNDYLILPGRLPQAYEIELTWHDQSFLAVSRPIPELDFVVEAGNRLWGCRCGNGVNELYGSKLGDFRNWNAFEGLSTDSYRVARGQDGPYTGAAVLGGCPLFFRADCLEKIYPSAAGDHGVVTVSLDGIEAGSADSAVVIRDRLYYKSAGGICCYNGTLPVPVSRALGDRSYHSAAAGALGSRYYLSMLDAAGQASLFVLNTDTGLWYREDSQRFLAAYSFGERLYLLPAAGSGLLCVGEARDSRDVNWWAETGELLPRMAERRYPSRLQLTARLELGASLRVSLRCDDGPWLRAGELQGNSLQSVTLSIPARRCQRLRLRLEGSGGMELHSLSWLTEPGSDV